MIFSSARHDGGVPVPEVDIGARVKELLQEHGVEQQDMAAYLRIDPSALSRAIKGERAFKAREIAAMAERLRISVASILESDAEEPVVAMAARKHANSPESVRAATERAAFYVDTAAIVGNLTPPSFAWLKVPDAGLLPWQQGQELASQVLSHACLDDGPLPGDMSELAKALETGLKIQLAFEPLGHGLDGLAVSCEHLKLALISTNTAAARQRWTVAHEIAHLVLADAEDDVLVDQNVWSKTPVETRANAFAGAFLMPEHLLRAEWGNAVTPSEPLVARLLDQFHVSLDALAFRLHNVGLVNASGRDTIRALRPFVSLIRNQANPQAEGWSWLPTDLTSEVIRAYTEGRLGARWLAALLRMDADELLERLAATADEVASHDSVDDVPQAV